MISGCAGTDDAPSVATRSDHARGILLIDILLVDHILYLRPIPVSFGEQCIFSSRISVSWCAMWLSHNALFVSRRKRRSQLLKSICKPRTFPKQVSFRQYLQKATLPADESAYVSRTFTLHVLCRSFRNKFTERCECKSPILDYAAYPILCEYGGVPNCQQEPSMFFPVISDRLFPCKTFAESCGITPTQRRSLPCSITTPALLIFHTMFPQ